MAPAPLKWPCQNSIKATILGYVCQDVWVTTNEIFFDLIKSGYRLDDKPSFRVMLYQLHMDGFLIGERTTNRPGHVQTKYILSPAAAALRPQRARRFSRTLGLVA